MNKYGHGWFNESKRHALARQGIKTGRKTGLSPYQQLKMSMRISKKANYARRISSTEFRIDKNSTIVARAEKTRNGFRHVAEFYKDGSLVESRSVSYLNRTWEKYEYQTAIKELLNKMALSDSEKSKIMNTVENKALGRVEDKFKSVAMVASLGDVFGKTKKEKSDWKLRMLKAGLSDSGLQVPEDWDKLSEDEKEKRLDKIIKLLKNKKKNYAKLTQKDKEKEDIIDEILSAGADIQEPILRSKSTEMEEDYLERLGKHLDRKSLKELKKLI